MDELISIDKKNIWHPFTPLQSTTEFPLIVKGEGVYLHTSDGRRIIDAVSSWWVNLHGHGNPVIARAIADQARDLEHVIFAGFTHRPAIGLSQNLLSILPAYSRVFFSDNGSTAVEVALKIAIQYWHNLGQPRKKVVAINGAYHGDTFGSMSVGERGLFTKPFLPLLFETLFIDFPAPGNAEKVVEQFRQYAQQKDVAAFIFEPLVQGAGGMRMYPAGLLDELLGYAKDSGIICVADEVFTGFGRTGKNFAIDHLTRKPDLIALSKGITGGFMPLGVTACAEGIVDAFDSSSFEKTFFHGHSYTANPLACAAANASFQLLVNPDCRKRIERIELLHKEFARSLSGNSRVTDARVLGTILAIEVKTEEASSYDNSIRSAIYPFFLERNILLRPLGNVIYVLPPYVITPEELKRIYAAIEEFLDGIPLIL